MLGRLLRGTEWARAADYLSPVFFQVVPTLPMGKRLASLASSYGDRKSFNTVCDILAPKIKGLGIQLSHGTKSDQHEPTEKHTLSAEEEEKVLTLYFWQLFFADTILLDYRRATFYLTDDGQVVWRPKPLFTRFDPKFAQGIREMYQGFYTANWTLFDQALKDLGLLHARDLFIAHFGASQSSMRFELSAFRKTFHELFVSCKENRSHLHPDFLAFGAGLFSLYENLEQNGNTFDVGAVFKRATQQGYELL
jgi:hypothetical protein